MKKTTSKQNPKLKLTAETLRSLDHKELVEVAGGGDYSQLTICFCAGSKYTICEM